MERNSSDADRFVDALLKHAPLFNVQLEIPVVSQVRAYYEFVTTWNARLHLVAPCTPEEFATRHVLESLLAVRFMEVGASVVDVGSGAGLPIIPCLIARPDLTGTLVESSKKKAVFLREALNHLRLGDRTNVSAERFERLPPPTAGFVTCRAIDRFVELMPKLFEWSGSAGDLLLFGGEAVRMEIERAGLTYGTLHVPESERRALFIVNRRISSGEI